MQSRFETLKYGSFLQIRPFVNPFLWLLTLSTSWLCWGRPASNFIIPLTMFKNFRGRFVHESHISMPGTLNSPKHTPPRGEYKFCVLWKDYVLLDVVVSRYIEYSLCYIFLFKDFRLGKPCTGIPWYNTIIDITAKEVEMQGASNSSHTVVITNTAANTSVVPVWSGSKCPITLCNLYLKDR